MLVGYARVSSTDQNIDTQAAALAEHGCTKIFQEKRSARSVDGRQSLTLALDFARTGDVLVVTRLDRLARSARDLHQIVATLDAKGVGFRCLAQEGVDTTTSTGKLTLAILGAVAAFEVDLRAERQREGIERAKAAGRYRGRQPVIDYEMVARLHRQGNSPVEIARMLKIGRSSIYRALANVASSESASSL